MYTIELSRPIRTEAVLNYFEMVLNCSCLFVDEESCLGKRFVYFASNGSSNGSEPKFQRYYHVFMPTKSHIVLSHHTTNRITIQPLSQVRLRLEGYKQDLEEIAGMEEQGHFPRFEDGAIVF